MNVAFHEGGEVEESHLKFVVVQANYKGQWIFVRHRERNTWEIPGGHIERGECPDEAARRELIEETGAIKFGIKEVCDYSVERNGEISYGRLYFAVVKELGILGEFEIAEIRTSEEMPINLTYKGIQPFLFERVKDFFLESD